MNHLMLSSSKVIFQINRLIQPFLQYHNMPKFCANLSFMFTETPLPERYQLAKNAGFKCVESGFPFGVPCEEIQTCKSSADIEQILINIYTGDVTKGEVGLAAIPGKEDEFKKSVHLTLEYAKAVGAKKIHIMAGKVENPTEENDKTYESNLRFAVKILEEENIMGIIEPINKYSVPHYYLNSYKKAVAVIEKINSPNLKLMLDIFHLQQIQGDISHTVKDLVKHIGHVQIAQVPNRDEPDAPGEINYKYVFDLLEKAGYDDWIGLEYKPHTTTVEGLKWIKQFNYKL